MATTIEKEVFTHKVQHVKLSSPKPLKAALTALYEEINKDKAGPALLKVLEDARGKEDLEKKLEELTEGKRDFLMFMTVSHSDWLNKLGDQKVAESYLISFGNPLIAKTFMTYDLHAGLYVPPRVLIQETEEGGTRVFYDVPSSTILIDENAPKEMREAVGVLDMKLERMLTKILSE